MDNKGTGVLDLSVYLEASENTSGTTAGIEGERTRGQADTPEVLEKRERPLRKFCLQIRSRRHGNASRVSTGRRQGLRNHCQGITWTGSRWKGRISMGADHLRGYECPSW